MEGSELGLQSKLVLIFAKLRSDDVNQAYQHQKETDANVVALFDKMAALYSFVDDLEEGLPSKIKRLESTILCVLEKTTECGKFFREYTERKFTCKFDLATLYMLCSHEFQQLDCWDR